MKNKVEIVHLIWHVWYKTQNYGRGEKVNPHFRVFYNTEDAIEFFNNESSAYKIEASCDVRNPKFMKGDGDSKLIFDRNDYLKT